MSDNTRNLAGQQRWTPRLAHTQDEGAAEPTTNAAASRLFGQLVAIAERGLGRREAAEDLVGDVLEDHATLFRRATAGHQSDSEAARSQLASIVRRATLDALPPVLGAVAPPPQGALAPVARQRPPRSAGQSPTEPGPGESGPHAPQPLDPDIFPSPAGHAAADYAAAGHTAAERAPLDTAFAVPRGVGIAGVPPRKKPMRRNRLPAIGAIAALVLLLTAGGLGAAFLWPGFMTPASEPLPSLPDPIAQETTGDPPAPGAAVSRMEASTNGPAGQRAASEAGASGDDGQLEDAVSLRQLAAPEPAAGASGPDGVPAPTAASTRLFLHFGDEPRSEDTASALYTALSREGGYPVVVLREVDYTIATPRVRFFHADDAAAAERLTGFLERTATLGGGWQLQNFTNYRPLPAAGTLEVYVPPS